MEKKMTGADMATRFSPQEIEAGLYQAWEKAGAFVAHREEGKKPFTIVMPPPNITGQLHMGHAMDCILQDAPVRYHRMKGDPTLWLPGTDHAAIATEVKIVEAMRKEGLSKKQSMFAARITVVVIAILAVIIARDPGSYVFKIVAFSWAGFGASAHRRRTPE